jgi:hypothetical protein
MTAFERSDHADIERFAALQAEAVEAANPEPNHEHRSSLQGVDVPALAPTGAGSLFEWLA